MLLFELVWKTIWLVAVGLPLWSAGMLTDNAAETARDCLFGVALIPFVIPWRYVLHAYLLHPGDRWRTASAG